MGDEVLLSVLALAARASVPVCVQLDHGADLEQALVAIRLSLTAVLTDGPRLDHDATIALTRTVVEVAHAVGVSVEGETGRIGPRDPQSAADLDAIAHTESTRPWSSCGGRASTTWPRPWAPATRRPSPGRRARPRAGPHQGPERGGRRTARPARRVERAGRPGERGDGPRGGQAEHLRRHEDGLLHGAQRGAGGPGSARAAGHRSRGARRGARGRLAQVVLRSAGRSDLSTRESLGAGASAAAAEPLLLPY